MPKFFAPEKPKIHVRDRALVYWDLDSVTPSIWNQGIVKWDDFIMAQVDKRIPKPDHSLYKVFSAFSHPTELSQLKDLDWRVREADADMEHHALSDAGQNPEASVVFLITANPKHEDLIGWLKEDGVLVYMMAPSSVSDTLVNAVGKKRWIKLDGLPGLPRVFRLDNEFGI